MKASSGNGSEGATADGNGVSGDKRKRSNTSTLPSQPAKKKRVKSVTL